LKYIKADLSDLPDMSVLTENELKEVNVGF